MTLDSADTAAQTVLTRLKADISGCDSGTLRLLLTEARSHNGWLDRPVADSLLKELYEIMRWGPTSANSSPARVVLLKTAEAKARLEPALKPNNVEKTLAAPVTAIIAHDTAFWTNAEKLFPHNPAVQLAFKDNPAGAEITGLMWTMLTLTIGMPDPQPTNTSERLFSVFVAIMAVCVVAAEVATGNA